MWYDMIACSVPKLLGWNFCKKSPWMFPVRNPLHMMPPTPYNCPTVYTVVFNIFICFLTSWIPYQLVIEYYFSNLLPDQGFGSSFALKLSSSSIYYILLLYIPVVLPLFVFSFPETLQRNFKVDRTSRQRDVRIRRSTAKTVQFNSHEWWWVAGY